MANGAGPAKAKSFRREVQDFYTLGADCLWVTIGQGRLWWAFAEPQVTMLHGDYLGHRSRSVIGGWSSLDLAGEALTLTSLSTRLTKVSAYQQTICAISAEDYLLRRINGAPEPAVIAARAARAASVEAARALIQTLDWRDFELLTDLIFSTGGWRRISAVGGSSQSDTDIIVQQAVTGERAFVQVKSAASPAVLADYVARYRADGSCQRMIFVCHSPTGRLQGQSDVDLWLGDALAEQAIRAGLLDWLIEKSR